MGIPTPIITIITPTTGKPCLLNCIESVQAQRGFAPGAVRHLIVIDGEDRREAVLKLKADDAARTDGDVKTDWLTLPYVTGHSQFNGHRIYAATSFLVDSQFIMWLDEDNEYRHNHVQTMFDMVTKCECAWAHSLRTIVENGKAVCDDNCESLGMYTNVLGDTLIDTSCFIIRTNIAWQLAPLWFRRARQPNTIPADRLITKTLLEASAAGSFQGGCTGQHTVLYSVGSREDSVKADFFLRGNKRVLESFPDGKFPWNNKQTYTPNPLSPETTQ